MRILRQVLILLQKDAWLTWRSKLWLFFEFLIGFLLLLLIIVIVNRAGADLTDSSSFHSVPISGGHPDIHQEVRNIDRIYMRWCRKNLTLAYTGKNADNLMKMVQARYNGSTTIYLKYFDDVESMRSALTADLNDTSELMCGTYLGGIIFDDVDFTNEHLKYRILFPKRMEQRWHLDQFWTEDGPYSAVADINSIPTEPSYWTSGFLSIQFAIENSFLDSIGKSINVPVVLQRMPAPPYRNSGMLAFLKQVPWMWSLMVLATIMHTLRNILSEKEAGIKTYMAVMGLDSVAFYGSHFIVGLIKVTIVIVICTTTFSISLTYVSASLFIEFAILFGMSAVMFAVLFSTIFRNSAVAQTAAIMSWILLIILDACYTTSLTNIGHCFLVSFNVYTAFKLGIKSAVMAESTATYLGWTTMFTNSTHSFTFGFATLMLIVDIIVMIVVSLYLDAVWPTDDSPRRSPFFIFGYNPHSANRMEVGDDEVDAPNENVETDAGMSRDQADIDVRKMSKIWETTGQMAVDNVSFRAYRGQVTVLLGQNGAGKSSTFAAISGSTTVTAGSVYICREEIQSKLSECQRQIGFCPQYNPLFARLTVREHLRLYARLKTMKKSEELNSEIETIVHQVGLSAKLDTYAENLSGGMKRKLCVAMSLIGGSRVILLDEPSAGMDPEARHDVQKLLEKTKRNKTILLTTHYMDEADLLGDRIAIMVKGRMACSGSPEFLKKCFGTGYVLTIVTEAVDTLPCTTFDAVMERILKVTRKHAPEARIDSHTYPEFSIILPVDTKAYFANLFEELETREKELSISSFGISFNTLEQVFLRVGELVDNNDDTAAPDHICQNTAALFVERPEYSGPKLYFNQVLSMLKRNALNVWRNKARTVTPVVISLLLFALFVGFGRFSGSFKSEQLDLSLTNLESVSIPIMISHAANFQIGFPFIASQMNGAELINLSSFENLTEALIDRAKHQSPPLGIGAYLMGNNTIMTLFNGAANHAPTSAILFVTNAMINKKPDSVQLGIEIYDVAAPTNSMVASSAESNLIVALIVILAFSSLTSTFIMGLVEERQSRFKHQLLLTKLHTSTYWLSYILWHLFTYICFCVLLTMVFVIFGWMKGTLLPNFILWTLYFWCCLPFIYCSSFVFSSPIKGYAGLLCWNVIVSLIALIADTILTAIQSRFQNEFHYIAFVILPSFSLGNGMVQIAIHSGVEALPTDMVYNALSQTFWCMFISGFIFWTLLFLLESKKISQMLYSVQCRIRKNPYQIINAEIDLNEEDEDVSREREALRTFGDDQYALAVRDVYKYYGQFCAVRNLTFGVRHNECFGLLGVNGAGKTTTFNIITGEAYANSGRATIGGVDVIEGPVIGYCPQFDALATELTGCELLTLLGQLNGFQNVHERVKSVLESICLIGKANSLIKFYSGGQKRRLSIGVTLMSKTNLIILDEPTAGIDPSTRRKIWQFLTIVRQHNVAILLTSHSMDECEALCNRIGFMNRGTLISIGSSQHLKSRYSTSYMLTITQVNPSNFSSRFLNSLVTRKFSAPDTTDPPTTATQHWEIPKGKESWSSMFRWAQQIADKYPHTANLPEGSELPLIIDFSLTQSSLEQVFLRLAENSHDSQLDLRDRQTLAQPSRSLLESRILPANYPA